MTVSHPTDTGSQRLRVSVGSILAVLLAVLLPIVVRADAALTVEGQGSLVIPGGLASYSLQLLNWTERQMPGGVIGFTLPAGISYVPGSTHVTVAGSEISTADPAISGATLSWGPFQVPAAGHTTHTPRGIHTAVQDLCAPEFIDLHLDQARALVGSGGYVTQMFYRITAATTAADACAAYFVNAAYNRNLVPILRLQGTLNPAGYWDRPNPGPQGDYRPVAAGFARYVAGLPRRDSHPLYIAVWNEPNLWIEWSNAPNAVEYARFFVAVSDAIRALNDPRIRILNGALTPGNWDDASRFIRTMLTVPGFVNAFDAWASHCYPYNHPPAYNLHMGTAKYGNTAIDCYLQERDIINQHGGRGGFKFVLTETGYALGDNTYGFEGLPRIDEANRAAYMQDAFDRYWPAWPEVIAVTPFLLGDPWNGWQQFDWIDYTVQLSPPQLAFTPHPQYTAVAALSQPQGQTVARGIQVKFVAQVASDLSPGMHFGTLCGRAGEATAGCIPAGGVRVVEQVNRLYLPTITKSPAAASNDGVWYLTMPAGGETAGDGGIMPTVSLTADADVIAGATQSATPIPLAGEVLVVTRAGGAQSAQVYAGTRDGQLLVVDVVLRRILSRIQLGFVPVALAAGPAPGSVYASAQAGAVYLLDAATGVILGHSGSPLQRPRGVVLDAAGGTLLVADAGSQAIVRFDAGLSQRLAAQALPDLPDQVFLDEARGRLLVTLPGANRVVALDSATLRPLHEAGLPGGPVLAAALDGAVGRLYVLSAASARYRIVTVLDADDLSRRAVVAGTPAAPLQRASALAAGGGRLWIADGDRLYGVGGDEFGVRTVFTIEAGLRPATLAADLATGSVVWVDEQGLWEYH